MMCSYGDSYSYSGDLYSNPAVLVITLLVSALSIVCMWKIFVKAGKPGWASIVPFYNLYVLFAITWDKGIKFLLLLIPIANIVFMVMTIAKLAKVFGKSGGFALGLFFLGFVFMPIHAFGKAQYVGLPSMNAAVDCRQYPQPAYAPQPQSILAQPVRRAQPVAPQQSGVKAFCPACGTPNAARGAFCENCGAKL